jgi:Tol biopolymer transport system component
MKNKKEKRSWLMKALSLTMMLAFIVPVMANAQAGKTNFSGTWTMNADKSTLPEGGQGRMGGGNLVATQAANALTVERTRTGRDGQPMTTTMKYTLDGKESVNSSPRGESKSVATWSADGKSLTIVTNSTMTFNGEAREMKSTEVWTLNDPKTLSITSTRTGQNGDVKMTLVYDKK